MKSFPIRHLFFHGLIITIDQPEEALIGLPPSGKLSPNSKMDYMVPDLMLDQKSIKSESTTSSKSDLKSFGYKLYSKTYTIIIIIHNL